MNCCMNYPKSLINYGRLYWHLLKKIGRHKRLLWVFQTSSSLTYKRPFVSLKTVPEWPDLRVKTQDHTVNLR